MELPFLDMKDPGFSTRSPEVLAARAACWCARTPYGIAVLRHRQAGQLLRDRRLRQGSHSWPQHIGLSGSFAAFWRRSIISLEGPEHKALRRVVQAALAEADILALVPQFEGIAEALCEGLRSVDSFEMVECFTEPFAGQAIALLLGRPVSDAAEIARDASTLGLAMGPEARRHETAVDAACDRLMGLADALLDDPPKGSFVARMLAAGETKRAALRDLVVISIFGGVDTTRAQLAFAIWLFAQNPTQWDWLRQNPYAVPAALDEVIRMRPTTTWASREALEDIALDGVTIRAGETVHILVHASGTDPHTGHQGRFDVTRPVKAHFGFGGGAHHCLGHFVARTDMASALRVLLRRWAQVELAGEADFLPDSGNTSPRCLPIKPIWA